MPTYAYVCSKCDREFEHFQSMMDEHLTVCPKNICGQQRWGKGKVKRQLGTGAGMIFKGSGFYITDYRSEGYKAAAKKDSAPAAAPAASPAAPAAPAASATAEKKSGGDSKSAKKT